MTPVYAVSGVNFSTLTYASIPTTTNATWNAATANWTNNGYRLPTEMEWMWAAMGSPSDGTGGSTNTSGYVKSFAGSTGSNSVGNYAWYNANSNSKTHPVGAKLPNENGFYDLSGNVYEWTWDWQSAYPNGTISNYKGAASGTLRVIRGNGWDGVESNCSVGVQMWQNPASRNLSQGFRVVRN